MLDLVAGEVAAVIVERAGGRLHAFRDLCAGRPLHVTHTEGGWALASEWQPLAAAANIRRRPNPEWFASAFVGYTMDAKATPYEGVEVVLPGHLATPAISSWRQVRAARWHVPRLTDTRLGAYAEQFRDIFDEAVRCRIDGCSGVAVTLSGGFDSTSVIASAFAVRPEIKRTALCVPMREQAGDETIMQAHMAERTESELAWVDIDGHGPLGGQGPDEIFERLAAPPLSINWYFGNAVAEYAREAGLRVVLDGEDGDGSVGGSRMFLPDLSATGHWLRWWREASAQREHAAAGGRELLTESLYMAAPPALRRAYVRRQRRSIVPPILAEGLAQRLELDRRLQHSRLNRTWAPGRTFRLAQGEVGKAEQIGPILSSISEPWRRRGLMLTHPWSDRRLMSFCMGLPYEHVCADALPKVVLRQAMEGRLPGGLLAHRGKADLSEVARRAAEGSERHYVEEGLRLARSQPEWFSAGEVAEIESEFESGRRSPRRFGWRCSHRGYGGAMPADSKLFLRLFCIFILL